MEQWHSTQEVFWHNPAPWSRRGTRIGGNQFYKRPGASSIIQDSAKKPKTHVFTTNIFRNKRTQPLLTLLITFKGPIKGDVFPRAGGTFCGLSPSDWFRVFDCSETPVNKKTRDMFGDVFAKFIGMSLEVCLGAFGRLLRMLLGSFSRWTNGHEPIDNYWTYL